jgi:hypothetical protein
MSATTKLSWNSTEPHRWTAEGRLHSYTVLYDPGSPYPFRVMQMRQPGGQVINRNGTVTLTGAQARAQVWEDGN